MTLIYVLINLMVKLNSVPTTVELDFKNCQDKNQLGLKNQIANDQVNKVSFKDRQDKNNMTLRTKMAVTKNVLKVKFDCIFFRNNFFKNRRVQLHPLHPP